MGDTIGAPEHDAGRGSPGAELRASVRVANGLELLGDFQSSGFRTQQYLVRRADGQLVHVSRLVHVVLAVLVERRHDGGPSGADGLTSLAAAVSSRSGLDVSTDNVAYLLEAKLAPAGLIEIAAHDDSGMRASAEPPEGPPAPPASSALLALRLRRPLIPAHWHRRLSGALARLFLLPLALATVAAVVVLDGWLMTAGRSSLLDALQELVRRPQLLLALTALTIVSAAFHELGHAAAAHRGGARPGAIGVGVYLVWPVFYTDVTDTYRLDRRGRLRTDLGGVYFNLLCVLAAACAWRLSGWAPLAAFVVVGQVETLRQFLPFIRLDGYYVVSDLAGVPNLFAFLPLVLTRLTRRADDPTRRQAEARLAELRRGPRRLITGWVLLTVPVLAVNVVLFLVLAPRLAGSAWVSVGDQVQLLRAASVRRALPEAVAAVLSLTLLVLPVAGLGTIVVRLAQRLGGAARTQLRRRPAVAAPAVTVAVALALFQCLVAWPRTFRASVERTEAAAAFTERESTRPPAPTAPVPETAVPTTARPDATVPPAAAPTAPPLRPIAVAPPAPPPSVVPAATGSIR